MNGRDAITVLLIADDVGDAQMAIEQLCNGGKRSFHVVRATNLAAALEYLKTKDVDVALLDLSLPDAHGVDTVDQLARHAPDLPVIVLSEASDEALALNAVQKGAQDYLAKKEASPGMLSRAILYAVYRKQSELKLTQTINALKEANQQILAQQKSVIEEERLKVLLQMAGATAHELNQPIMTLLGTIEIMQLDDPIPPGWDKHLERIETAGRRIANIVKKITTIRNIDYRPYPGGTSIINLEQQINVLAVEDDDVDYERIKRYVTKQSRVTLSRAINKVEALRCLEKYRYDLVFLDYLLPDGNGIEVLQWLKTERRDVPVIAITGHGDEIVASRMIKAGALDYLPKANIRADTLMHCIHHALEKYRLKKEAQRATEKMVQMATRDPLTGLYNRHYMTDVLEKEFGLALRYGTALSCLLLDLDLLKEVNDTYGHRFGDFVLQQFAQRLRNSIRETDTCFRYGDEEFLVLLPQTDSAGAREMALKLCKQCENEPYTDGDTITVTVTISAGISAMGSPEVSKATELLTYADKALCQAKIQGRNRVKVYSQTLSTAGTEKQFQQLRQRLLNILDKAKKASLSSLVSMAQEMGGERFKSHNQRVVHYLDLIGERLHFSPAIIQSLQRAALLHDFTKVLLGNFYQKAQLSADEKAEIENHPFAVTELIEPFDFFADERTVLLWHHENYDGTGYPDGLCGDEIPLGARLFAIVDALVAMTSERPYKKFSSSQDAVRELMAHAGTQFDPALVKVMIEVIKENGLMENSPQETQEGAGGQNSAGSPHGSR